MNRLPGTITGIEVQGSIALVEATVGSHPFTAMIVGATDTVAAWRKGMSVALLFKETEVALAKNLSGLISMRNRLPATVISIERGTLLAKITLQFNGHVIDSVITTKSSHTLALKVGDHVEGLVKANEMTLLPEVA